MKLLKYIHPAISKYDIKKSYELQELQKELSDDMIEIMFEPLNFEWKKQIGIVEEEIIEETVDKIKRK